jgi:hypothetical protein
MLAVDPPPNDGRHDFAVGGFQGGADNNVAFSARSGPQGHDPQGHLSQTMPQVRKDRFTVTCLAVAGSNAALGLTPANAQTAANFPNGRVLGVRDNGPPVGGQSVDQFGYFFPTSPDICPAYVGVPTIFVPASGNILVHDAMP